MAKIWKNESKIGNGGYYYTTTFYDKNKDGEEVKKNVNISFQRGLEPNENLDGEFLFKAADGKEYNVMLKAYKKQDGTVEPKLFMWDPSLKGNTTWQDKASDTTDMYTKKDDTDDYDEDLPF